MLIGEKIRERRIELNMTQEELAKAMNYKSKTTINKIEMGINDIPLSKVEAFAKALHTTPAHLMGWNSDVNSIPWSAKDESAIDAILTKYSHAAATEYLEGDVIGQLIDVALGLDDDKMQQLINYAKFLSQEEQK